MEHVVVKRIYLIPCFQSQLPWHRKLIEALVYPEVTAVVLDMPTPRKPRLDVWLAEMRKQIKPPWHEVGLVGHSIGAAAVLYFIQRYVRDAELAGTVLVAAGSKFNLPQFGQEIETFQFQPNDMTGVLTGKSLMITGENDRYLYGGDSQAIAAKLNAEHMVVPGAGHFGIADGPHERSDLPKLAKDAILNHFGYFPR